MRLLNREAIQTISSNIEISSKYDKTDKFYNINKNGLNPNPIVERPVNMLRR